MGYFQPSHLGTKEHWDDHYMKELENFDEFADEGEIWFGKSSEQRIIRYMLGTHVSMDSKILDLGCGNGHLCILMAKKGFTAVTGVDYSHHAIELSNKLADDSQLSSILSFKCVDILSSISMKKELKSNYFDVAIDKGTFDAVCLYPDGSDPQNVSTQSRDLYLEHVHDLLKPEGKLLITSCNWSSAELKGEFERTVNTRKLFEFFCEVPALQTFTFGGATGATTVCLVFRRIP